MRRRSLSALRGALAVGGVALVLAGCGIDDPTVDKQAQRAPDQSTQRTPADPDDATSPAPAPAPLPQQDGGAGAPTAQRAAASYALTFTNWTWRDVAQKNAGQLARLAAGDLRRTVQANARALAADGTLERDRSANRGTQVAIDEQGSDASRRTVWIVLRETASSRGVAGATDTRMTIYRAVVERLTDGRWYVTKWEAAA